METNLYCPTRTGRTISEKTMEDGNVINTKDEKNLSASLVNLYSERVAKFTTNGHDFIGETSSPPLEHYRHTPDSSHDDKYRKRINPLRIRLGKRPFIDNSPPQQYSTSKKRKLQAVNDNNVPIPHRVPKLIPKCVDRNKFHNVAPQPECVQFDDEHNKPVPRLVPKSQVQQLQYRKAKPPEGAAIKCDAEYAQNLSMQPMVKFKCRKCCSQSFKTLGKLKEHQMVCRAPVKEPVPTPEAAAPVTAEQNTGTPRVPRKVYLCSACGTYYENWNLFLHMKESHNRHICLFCLGMFSKAEKLSAHLMNKHNVKEFNYNSKEDFYSVYEGTLYLMCCVCEEICSEQDDFFNHDCNKVIPKPVPVRVNRLGIRANSVKPTKVINELSTNCSAAIVREPIRPISDKKDYNEVKPETLPPTLKPTTDLSDCEPANSDTSIHSENSTATIGKDSSNNVDSGMELDSCISKSDRSPIQQQSFPIPENKSLTNGDDSLEHSDCSDSNSEDIESPPIEDKQTQPDVPILPPAEKEREGGIKLKLSLNNAHSPVIINSTVDPSIGQSANKPPRRARRPPKRYEKEPSCGVPASDLPRDLPRTPTIKMTICDKPDNPFVKTTIYENNQATTLRTLLNNNLETELKSPEHKQDSAIKSTIYDNKIEDDISLNRVPKLTVRVPKELLDKESSSDYSSDSDVSDKLTVDENNITIAEPEAPTEEPSPDTQAKEQLAPNENNDEVDPPVEEKVQIKDENIEPKIEPKTECMEQDANAETTEETLINVEPEPELPVTELCLDKPLDKYPLKDLLKVFLSSTMYSCIYCNHARKVAVNCEQLALHMVAEHRFSATVDSITAEELMPGTITAKVKSSASELRDVFINLDSYDSVDKLEDVQYDNLFECFQCYFKTGNHKDLYLHNRKMHQKTILLCVMCKGNFYSYSELLCHLCPGAYDSEYEIKYRCYLCNVDVIPSSFRLMVHLRKIHHTCDVCLEFCHNQARLSNHVWKHKLNHLCYRCGIAYRNKPDITNHLFWKHGTESVLCKKCLQKKWPHVYHFCSPPAIFFCEECSLQFTKAVSLKVHKRFHSGECPHVCTEEGCTEKFVSKKLLMKHMDVHKKELLIEDLTEEKPTATKDLEAEAPKENIPVINLVDDDKPLETGAPEIKSEAGTEQLSKKAKKKKLKDKDALLLDVNLPELNLSESDSSDESDSGIPPPASVATKEEKDEEKLEQKMPSNDAEIVNEAITPETKIEPEIAKTEGKTEPTEDDKPCTEKVLEIWDNFKKYQEQVDPIPKPKEKTPPLVPIRKHVCESDHDYCLLPNDLNGDEDIFNFDKKKSKKSPKKKHNGLSSSSSSSSDSDSSCSCGSNCSCSSSSGSSSSSSSDSDSSDESGNETKKINKQSKKKLTNRRISNGSNVDVMGLAETPILIPEKVEPPVAESDLETEESETDEEFYDEHPQRIANKMYEEKRNQLMLASAAPSDGGSVSGETSRPVTPTKEEKGPVLDVSTIEKPPSSKKKSKKKKKSKSSKRHAPIKINIPKEVIAKPTESALRTPLAPNKITISLQSNTVHVPDTPNTSLLSTPAPNMTTPASSDSKRASKRRRVPNRFYGYSSDEETPQSTTPVALKPHQPPKLEWRKEDLPSPVTHKPKKEIPSTILSNRLYNSYTDSIRLTTPIPDPEPPKILMNTESMESSDSDSSDEGGLEIYQGYQSNVPPPPSYLNSGTSSLPYAFQRPAVRQAREGESVYCYCRCPYDEVSEMIACDAEGCPIEWFHFECVGIMVPPKGKWYCPECRKNQSFSGFR